MRLEDEKYPETLYMVYPKRNMVLNDEEFAYNVLDYRGLFDIDIQDVRYGDIMIYCGEVCKDVPSVYSDIIKRENIVSKVNDLIVKNGSVQYKIEQAAWNGYEWNEENGSFTNDGVVRFENTCMQALETYDEIDVEVLEACFENII